MTRYALIVLVLFMGMAVLAACTEEDEKQAKDTA